MQKLGPYALACLLASVASAQQPNSPEAAWRKFQATHGHDWQAEWNAGTGTPKAIFGPGLKLGERIASLETARQQSRALLTRFATLLGRGDSRFVESIGVRAGRVFVFVFDQTYRDLTVIGGRADVRIHDVGVVSLFGARAVTFPPDFDVTPTLTATAAKERALAQLFDTATSAHPRGRGEAPRLVIWADTQGFVRARPHLAWEVQIDSPAPARAFGKAYIDARDGSLLRYQNGIYNAAKRAAGPAAREPAPTPKRRPAVDLPKKVQPGAMALTGTVMAWVNLGHRPTDPLTNVPMPNLHVTSLVGNATTDAAGRFSIPYTGSSTVTVYATLWGAHCKHVRVQLGTRMTASTAITPGTPGTIQFGRSGMGVRDRSQTTTYYFVDDINRWIRNLMPGAKTELDLLSTIDPIVNLDLTCNATYQWFTINFRREDTTCENSAFETVIQHEWGHAIDDVFGGISQADGLSEGWADTLCLFRSRQSEVGPAFVKSNPNGIRSGNNTRTYPAGGGVHQQGETWMGFNWDVRRNLMATHGAAAGEALAIRIIIPSIAANAIDQPEAVREVFLLDDNDGNLNNGTPNYADLEKAAQKRRLPYPQKRRPDAGTYESFGTGCLGSGRAGSRRCPSANERGGSHRLLLQDPFIYAIRVPPQDGDITVTAFEFYTASRAGPRTIDTQIYLADANGAPMQTPVRTGRMALDTSIRWYRGTLTTPLRIPRGTTFFLSYTPAVGGMYLPMLATGRFSSFFYRDLNTTTWIGVPPRGYYAGAWGWKVNCAPGSGGAIPVLSNRSVPELGKSFSVDLAAAQPNATAILLLGASNSRWGTTNLPLDLGPLGAPGCSVLVSGEAQILLRTSARGTYSHTFPIPGQASLFGLGFYNQYVIEDPKNPFRLVFSNGGNGKIGR